MFIYGILLAVSRDCAVLSNQESGKGRSDCIIKPTNKRKNAVVAEFKHIKGEPADLKLEAAKGLDQIEGKSYTHNLKKEGYANILPHSRKVINKHDALAPRLMLIYFSILTMPIYVAPGAAYNKSPGLGRSYPGNLVFIERAA